MGGVNGSAPAPGHLHCALAHRDAERCRRIDRMARGELTATIGGRRLI